MTCGLGVSLTHSLYQSVLTWRALQSPRREGEPGDLVPPHYALEAWAQGAESVGTTTGVCAWPVFGPSGQRHSGPWRGDAGRFRRGVGLLKLDIQTLPSWHQVCALIHDVRFCSSKLPATHPPPRSPPSKEQKSLPLGLPWLKLHEGQDRHSCMGPRAV